MATAIENRKLIEAIAAADTYESFEALLTRAGITGTKEQMQNAYQGVALCHDRKELISLFHDHSYYSCFRRLAEKGIETSPAEFDMIKDIFAAANDSCMSVDMNKAKNTAQAAEVLKMHGHYHITEDFLNTMVKYSNLLMEAGIFTEEDYAEMTRLPFDEKAAEYVSLLSAISVLTSLRYGITDTLEIPYIIGIAGCTAFIRERFN